MTIRQQGFIDYYTNRDNLDTYGNATKSYIAAGYADNPGARVNACKLLTLPYIKSAIASKIEEKQAKGEIKQVITLDRLDSELFDLLNKCKNENDRTNAVATLRLIGQRVSAYTDKQQVTQIDKPDMTQHDEQELAKLARDYNIRLASG